MSLTLCIGMTSKAWNGLVICLTVLIMYSWMLCQQGPAIDALEPCCDQQIWKGTPCQVCHRLDKLTERTWPRRCQFQRKNINNCLLALIFQIIQGIGVQTLLNLRGIRSCLIDKCNYTQMDPLESFNSASITAPCWLLRAYPNWRLQLELLIRVLLKTPHIQCMMTRP